MKYGLFALMFVMLSLLPRVASAADLSERWAYGGVDIADDATTDEAIEFLATCKAAGVTHIQCNDGMLARLDTATPAYIANVKRFLEAADENSITVIPSVYAFGYSGRYLRKDSNLAAGLPARNVPFIVKDGVATPDPSTVPPLANTGFDQAEGDSLAAWKQDLAGAHSFVDTKVKHSGASSLKITNLDSLPDEAKGSVRVTQTLDVTPFQYYRLTVWTKNEDIAAEGEEYATIYAVDESRRILYTALGVNGEKEDWTKHDVIFNTLETTKVVFSFGVANARSGAIWFDDITIEPAGLLNVLRRDSGAVPFTVTNADASITYTEGKDFLPVSDPELDAYDASHVAPKFLLAENSSIEDGQTLLISYFHPVKIYYDQVGCSMTEPKIFDIMDDQMKRVAEIWPCKAYFMNYDEIRVGAWEVRPDELKDFTPGQLLAWHTKRGYDIVKKYAPDADVYTWSDMYTPFHNARPFAARKMYYYLVNGNWDGAWENLPSDIVIMNWYAPSKESVVWFADLGHKQVVAGYYDGDMKANIKSWMERTQGVPNVVGMMYTTWRGDYSNVAEFFQLLQAYPDWVEKEPATDDAIHEK